MHRLIALVALVLVPLAIAGGSGFFPSEMDANTLSQIEKSVEQTRSDTDKIIDFVLGPGKGQVWDRLALFTDTIGERQCGTPRYDAAAAFMLGMLEQAGLQNVHGENATVPKWVRGTEYATLLSPRVKNLAILGLGTSVGTQNTTAKAIVVSSFDDLHAKAKQGLTQGKIIVYNQSCDWVAQPVNCYGVSVQYRVNGAAEAAKVGGIAALVRSVTSFSLYTPHTGEQGYQDGIPQIPVASITVEDAELLARMQLRGETLVIQLHMDAMNYPPVVQQNIVAEIKGSVYPDEIVLLSGHLDSWDVGNGAMDDGGGAFISWQALSLIQQLGIQPKRTMRAVLWACEEFGGIGSSQYAQQHQDEVPVMSLVMESDLGVFHPQGIQFTGTPAAMQVMQQVGTLLTRINATLVTTGGEGTDIAPWMAAGVPGASLANDNQDYFFYHHSNADTMTVIKPDDIDLSSITWAVTALGVANLDAMLPR